MQLPEDISDLLNAEFARLVETVGGAPCRTNAQQAAWFGKESISASQLSRIRNGRTVLTRENADVFAAKLRPVAAEQRSLANRLLEASRRKVAASAPASPPDSTLVSARTVSLDNVQDLFRRLECDGSLLCVEYRDMPRAGADQKYSVYAEVAGRAIARGLSFAMFQPFGQGPGDAPSRRLRQSGSSESSGVTSNSGLPPYNLLAYLSQLKEKVRRVRGDMLHAAVKAAQESGIADQKEAEGLIRRRLILYERKSDQFDAIGIQSRLFYAEYNTTYLKEMEIWEWVAASGQDLFVRREDLNTPPAAISEQFHPVVWFFRHKGYLPASNAQLEQAVTDYADDAQTTRPCPWSVYEDSRT